MKKLHGVITAMTTPFDNNDVVDLVAVGDLTDFYIDKGVHCLYPNGTTGEMYLMPVEERKKIAEAVVRRARGRATVFIHTGAMTLKDTLELSEHACKSGADGIGVVTPSYFGVTEQEMESYYVDVATSLPDDFPVYLYNIPQLSGNDLKPKTVSTIASRCPNVIGIKYSYPDFTRVHEYLQLNDGDFSVVIGADKLFLAGLLVGCDGLVSGVAGVCPEPFVMIYDAFRTGDIKRAANLQKPASQIADVLRNGSNMAYFKAMIRARGLYGGNMRRPLMNLPDDEAAPVAPRLAKLLNELDVSFAVSMPDVVTKVS